MRNMFFAAILLAAPLVPAAAHADTFTFTPTSGTAISFTLNPSSPFSENAVSVQYLFVTFAGGNIGNGVIFHDPSVYAADGLGPMDLTIEDTSVNDHIYNLSGPQLYTFSGNTLAFIPGIYILTPDINPAFSNTIGGTLVIDGGTPTITPEPSSFVLLCSAGLVFVFSGFRPHRTNE